MLKLSSSVTLHRIFDPVIVLLFLLPFIPSTSASAQSGQVDLSGELRKWHPISLTLDGPATSETSSPNPFLDYRFEVTFTNGAITYTVPGFFAADGDAANTSATSGSKWRVRFTPDQTGTWTYTISFREGSNVAIADSPSAGTPNGFDGISGTFFVEDTNKTGVDLRARGILRHVGEHYLRFDNGEWFIVNGAGSPENMMGYSEFDNTFSSWADYTHEFAPHIQDWQSGDPTWQGSKGKGIMGLINYLSSRGVNAQFIIIMNTEGDGRETFPWIGHEDFLHFDVSKLEQWYIVLEHMNHKGIVPQLVLQEMDNDFLLDNGELGTTRKMFFREMAARFGQLNGVQWNIGEEHDQFELGGNTDAQRLDYVTYLAELDVYNHNIVMHTSAGQSNYEPLYGFFLGNPDFGGMSYHIHGIWELGIDHGGGPETHKWAELWHNNSANSGRKWTLTLDECCGWFTGVKPDQSNIEDVRKYEMWGTLMAGGAGFHWYLGFGEEFRDLTLENLRQYEFLWDVSGYAASFFTTYVPFQEMSPMDELTPDENNHVFAKPGEYYVVFLTDGGSTTLDLQGYSGTYSVDWYNPRTGGGLVSGAVTTINGSGIQSLGNPPFDTTEDWAVLVRNQNVNTVATLKTTPNPIAFAATPVGSSATTSVQLESDGTEALTVTSVSITGADAAAFSHNVVGTIQVPASGTTPIAVTFAPTSQGNQSAQLSISHSGVNSPLIVSLTGSASSDAGGSSVLYRINAGGGLISSAPLNWVNDRTITEGKNVGNAEMGSAETNDPSPYVNAQANGDWTWGLDDVMTMTSSVPAGTPMDIFKTGRWDASADPQMQWDIPVEAGIDVEVRLYFSEIRFQSNDEQDAPRIFSVLIDGQEYPGFSNINLLDEAGYKVGIMKSAVITSDGNIDIDFVNIANDPIVMGIEINGLGGMFRSLAPDWNLVGVPVTATDPNYTSIFDDVQIEGTPFEYTQNSYVATTSLSAGKGYWIQTTGGGVQLFDGEPLESITLTLDEGWNMISGPNCTFPINNATDPSGILQEETLFVYQDGYANQTELVPGYGYWIKTIAAGTVTLDCGAASKAQFTSSTHNLDNFGILEITDSRNQSQQLYVGGSLYAENKQGRYAMPPLSPAGFDVRFMDDTWLNQDESGIISIKSAHYPISVHLKRAPRSNQDHLYLQSVVRDGLSNAERLDLNAPVVLTDPSVQVLKLSTQNPALLELPEQFVLKGNYPNPFNPTTSVVFDLPEDADVHVEVYDMLGRLVMATEPQQYNAGNGHQLSMEAHNMASGTYIYHVKAQTATDLLVEMGTMTFLK